uniref:Ribulose bisphosphate carboxylase/oxygenase activase, chloroplastic n=1 Tax=Chlamydomonas euryale TaxID=1486919 RepID=A0A7R9VL64_9CHLO
MGTHQVTMSSTDYMSQAQRNFDNIADGFYISPAFLDKMTIHVAKNFMDLPKIKVPLILGIWGGKGQGKTFQCTLAYKKLGIAPIVMSAGELESGNAGEPAKLIRQRYREASDVIKKGKMCSLFINDLDAGAGRMGLQTQYTVNNQMVNATLMNIADNPTNVQLPGVYKQDTIPRVPVICTGNDFSTLYAPLIRDGRMEKYYWNPTREDRIGVCMGIFAEDNVNRGEVETLVDSFPGQSIDFFGALRARVYDDKVREFVKNLGVENMGKRLINSREGKVEFAKPTMSLDVLMRYGRFLVEEQENVKRVQLADEYMAGASLAGETGSSLPEGYTGGAAQLRRASPAAPPPRASAPQQRAPAPPPPSNNGSAANDFSAWLKDEPKQSAPAQSGGSGATDFSQWLNADAKPAAQAPPRSAPAPSGGSGATDFSQWLTADSPQSTPAPSYSEPSNGSAANDFSKWLSYDSSSSTASSPPPSSGSSSGAGATDFSQWLSDDVKPAAASSPAPSNGSAANDFSKWLSYDSSSSAAPSPAPSSGSSSGAGATDFSQWLTADTAKPAQSYSAPSGGSGATDFSQWLSADNSSSSTPAPAGSSVTGQGASTDFSQWLSDPNSKSFW